MGRSMKAIPPDAVAPVKVIGQRVQVSFFGHRRVKGGIEYRHLWCRLAEDLPHGANATQVVGIVKRREVDALLDPLHHLVVDDYGLLEQLAAVHNTVSDCMDVAKVVNLL